jgi:hypothetical protein
MLDSAATGALAGGVAGAGHSVADTPRGVAEDAAAGAQLGAALGGAAPAVQAAAARTVVPWLRHLAERMAVRAVAPTPGLTNRLHSVLGLRSQEDIQAFGRRLLDEGLVPAGGTPASTLERAQRVTQAEGGRIGEVLEKADKLVKEGVVAPPSRHLQRIAVRQAIAQAADTPVAQAEAQPVLQHLLERVGEAPSATNAARPATFRELWTAKSQLQRALKPEATSSLGQQLYREGVAGYTRGVYRQLEDALGPVDAETVREAARRYGVARQAEKLLEQEVTRAAARQPVGLLDTQLGQVAGTTGIPLAGPAVTALSAAFRSRLPSAIARAADALAKPRPARDVAPLVRAVTDYEAASREEKGPDVRPLAKRDEEEAVTAFLSGP